jgi:predicted nucleic acid-binding protein
MESLRTSLRVMVDANVLVAGMGWPRWPYAVLQHAVAGDFQLVLSPYIVEEAQRHLGRIVPAALLRLETFLQLSACEVVADPPPEIVAANRQLVRDAKDVPVALAAIQAAVDCLVSNDRDLTESKALKDRIAVFLPAIFLRDYMSWSSEELEIIRRRNWSDLT